MTYQASPDRLALRIAEEQMMIGYYKARVLALIEAKRGMDRAGLKNSAWSFGMVKSNFYAWRSCRRALATMQGVG